MAKLVQIVSNGEVNKTKVYDVDGNDVTGQLAIKSIKIDIEAGQDSVVAMIECYAEIDILAETN